MIINETTLSDINHLIGVDAINHVVTALVISLVITCISSMLTALITRK